MVKRKCPCLANSVSIATFFGADISGASTSVTVWCFWVVRKGIRLLGFWALLTSLLPGRYKILIRDQNFQNWVAVKSPARNKGYKDGGSIFIAQFVITSQVPYITDGFLKPCWLLALTLSRRSKGIGLCEKESEPDIKHWHPSKQGRSPFSLSWIFLLSSKSYLEQGTRWVCRKIFFFFMNSLTGWDFVARDGLLWWP